jgi:signal transduction histidine kinase
VRHVAQNHGGAVSVSSREGEGSTFMLDLPLSGT